MYPRCIREAPNDTCFSSATFPLRHAVGWVWLWSETPGPSPSEDRVGDVSCVHCHLQKCGPSLICPLLGGFVVFEIQLCLGSTEKTHREAADHVYPDFFLRTEKRMYFSIAFQIIK
jgi:hypothetical protein